MDIWFLFHMFPVHHVKFVSPKATFITNLLLRIASKKHRHESKINHTLKWAPIRNIVNNVSVPIVAGSL